MAKMDEGEFEAIVGGEIDDAIDFVDDEISPLRARATAFYRGEIDVEAEEGRSHMVSRDVRDVVNAIMPSLMRVFFSTDRVVEYCPTGPEDEEIADQATDYANFVLTQENDGFSALHAVFKDALVRKAGFLKVWWHEADDVSVQRYTGISQEALTVLQAEADEVEINGQSMRQEQGFGSMGEPMMTEVAEYDITVTKRAKKGRIRIEEVPPEEVLVARRDKKLGESYLGHRKMLTVSELVAMGYSREEVEEHTTDEDFTSSDEYLERRSRQWEHDGSTMNEALRRVRYVESYVRVDRNNDGIAELWKVCTIGSGHKILHAEEVDCHPLVAFTVDPEPHVSPLEAMSKADDLMDVQRLKSVVWRNSLDALAQTINPRTVVIEGRAEMMDVLNNEVGAVIRAKSPDAVIPLMTPDTSAQGLQMLAYVDQVKEARTGISNAAMGLDADALRSTAKNAANAVVTATQSQMEMAARMLSNGFKDLFRLILKLMRTHQDKEKIVRLRNKWVPIDPRTWADMDVSVNVALGSGTDETKFAVLAQIAMKQEQLMAAMGPTNPVAGVIQYSNTLAKMVELAGIRNVEPFVNRLPKDFQMPPAPPAQDPQAEAAKMLAQVEQQKAQMKMQIDAAKLQADQQVAQAKMQAESQYQAEKLRLEQEKMQAEHARKQLELEMQAAKMQAELQIKEAESVLKQLTALKGRNDDAAQEEAHAGEKEASDARQEGMLSQAITALGQMIAQSQVATAQAMNTPKRVVRDEMGRVTGVEPLQ